MLSAQAEGKDHDKSQYHLFNPTPTEFLRELSTDRPDKTESPNTVDAGHFQIEMDLVSYTHDRDQSGGGDTVRDEWAIAPINLKVGLLNWMDLQVVLDSYNHVREHDRIAPIVRRRSGFGDVTTRVKMNLWGNDGGSTALALMPYLKFPTNQDGLGNHALEPGLIVPLAFELPAQWEMVVMTQLDVVQNENNNRYHQEYVNTVTFAHDIFGNLGGYIEFFSSVSSQSDSDWVGTVDLGLTYGLTDNIQLDGGVNIGVTESADDINPFLGLSVRF